MAKILSNLDQDEPAIRKRATPARQGFLDRDILVVLVLSTALAIVVLFVALALNSGRMGLDGRQGGDTRLTNPVAAGVANPTQPSR